MLTNEELRWISNRKQLWQVLLKLQGDKITVGNAEKQIRAILYRS